MEPTWETVDGGTVEVIDYGLYIEGEFLSDKEPATTEGQTNE